MDGGPNVKGSNRGGLVPQINSAERGSIKDYTPALKRPRYTIWRHARVAKRSVTLSVCKTTLFIGANTMLSIRYLLSSCQQAIFVPSSSPHPTPQTQSNLDHHLGPD